MKPRHYIIIGFLFFTIALMWVDKTYIAYTQRYVEKTWETRSQEKTSLLNWYEETVKVLEEENEFKGMCVEDLKKIIEEIIEEEELKGIGKS